MTTRFLDTNEFSLADVPAAERLLIGPRTTGRLGARHSPDVARAALEESRAEVEALIAQHSVVVVIGTGGKGTGAGTIFPLAQIARQDRKLVLPIFVRPSFERHEVDKRRYDHAVQVAAQFDAAKIRLMEILNDRGYLDENPEAQSVGVGAHEPADCQKPARVDLRTVGFVAGRSVRFVDAVRGQRPISDRVCGTGSANR